MNLKNSPYFIDSLSTKHKNKFIVCIVSIGSLSIFSFGWLFGVHHLNSTKYVVDIWAALSSVGSLLSGFGTVVAASTAWLAYKNWLNPIKAEKELELDSEFLINFRKFHKNNIYPLTEMRFLEVEIFKEVRNHHEHDPWDMNAYQERWQEERDSLSQKNHFDFGQLIKTKKALLEPLEELPRGDDFLLKKIKNYLLTLNKIHLTFHGFISIEKVEDAAKCAELNKCQVTRNGHTYDIMPQGILQGGELMREVECMYEDIIQIMTKRLGY
tara:strand:+ start:1095 stop:1901 length:807 start_codon:yes stop_codon:yes gene_type:complete